MTQLLTGKTIQISLAVGAQALLAATLAWGVTPNTRTFTAGEKAKVEGTILSRDGNTIKLRGDDDSIGTVDLTEGTKIQLKKGAFIFRRSDKMDLASLVPGLHVEAQGKGNDHGDLVADKVSFDPNSMRASKQIDTRVSPLEARAGTLEGRAGTLEGRANSLEGRAGTLETRAGQMEEQEKQTQGMVGQVKTTADQATQGVTDVNKRVSDIDNYDVKDSATVYFRLNSATLSPDAKRDLDDIAKKALAQKGYMVEIAGFADKTGNSAVNQALSERRAQSVINYLQQQGDIPIHRILAPAGMGTSHEAADNKTAEGRKMNRRVEVKILVNEGLVAGAGQTSGNSTAKPATEPSR
jgi:outer membrane protein OmpA-like peptidoglycan-associated protein